SRARCRWRPYHRRIPRRGASPPSPTRRRWPRGASAPCCSLTRAGYCFWEEGETMRPVTNLPVRLVASRATPALVYPAVQNRVMGKPAPVAQVTVAVKPVVVTAGEVPLGSKLTADQLKLVDWPVTALPANAFDAKDALIGRVALTRMVNNEAVTSEKLAPT